MADLALVAAVQVDGSHVVTRGTTQDVGSNIAMLGFDDSKTKYEIQQGVAAIMRNLSRLFLRTDLPAEVPTSGSDRE